MSNKEYNITHTQMGGGELKEDVGGGSSTLAPATADTLGGVKIGNGISVTEDGTISAQGGGDKPTIVIPVYGKQDVGHNAYEDEGANIVIYNELLPAYEDGTPVPDEDPDASKLCHLENFDPEALMNSDSAYIEMHISKSYGAPTVQKMPITVKVYDDTEGQEMVMLHAEFVQNQFLFSSNELQDTTMKMVCYVMLVKLPEGNDWVSMLNKSEAASGMLTTSVTKTLS